MRKTNKITTSAVLIALGIILPTIFHSTGISGQIFLPMHIPVLIAGLLLGGWLGMLIGIALPIINHFITGMPPVPILYTMIVELAIYGLVAGILYKKVRMTLFPSLIFSMLAGRIGSGLMLFITTYALTGQVADLNLFIQGTFITALPGIIIQIIIIPIIIRQYERSQKTIWY